MATVHLINSIWNQVNVQARKGNNDDPTANPSLGAKLLGLNQEWPIETDNENIFYCRNNNPDNPDGTFTIWDKVPVFQSSADIYEQIDPNNNEIKGKEGMLIAPPIVSFWVGVYLISVIPGNSTTWGGFEGNPLDSFGIANVNYGGMVIRFTYQGRFTPPYTIDPTGKTYVNGRALGYKCGAIGPGYLLALAVSQDNGDTASPQAPFDVCYQTRFTALGGVDHGVSQIAKNFEWTETPPHGCWVSGLLVYLQPKQS